MLIRNHVLETLFRFYTSIWILDILRKKFNRIHVIQKLCLRNIVLVLYIRLDINSGGARIWVEGEQNLYKIYAFYVHISYVFKKKKKIETTNMLSS